MPQQPWAREQDLAVLYLNLAYEEQLTPRHPAISRLAKAMQRTRASVWRRKVNFDSLDPSVPGQGLNHPAKLTVASWTEFARDPKRVLAQARRAYRRLVK